MAQGVQMFVLRGYDEEEGSCMTAVAPLFDILTRDQREILASLIQQNKDATWVVEGGFTPLSETRNGNGEYTPYWGKVVYDGDTPAPGAGPSASEEMTFADALTFRALLRRNRVGSIMQYLTLSDSHWYKISGGPLDGLPHEKRRALSGRLSQNPASYVPHPYRARLEKHPERDPVTLDVVLQHTFSPTFQHCLTNGYANLRKKKSELGYALRFHERMFVRKRGWLYLEGDMDGGEMKMFSGSSARAPVFEEDGLLERSVKQEGAVGVTYSYVEANNGESRHVNTHLCGSVSAGRILWLAKEARSKKALRVNQRVVTVHIHDSADDTNIGRKLLRGMMAASNVGPENSVSILLIKSGEVVDLFYSYGNNRGRLSDGSSLHTLLGFKEAQTMDNKIDTILGSLAFREIFDRELARATQRASSALGVTDVRLLQTGERRTETSPDTEGDRQCEVMCGM